MTTGPSNSLQDLPAAYQSWRTSRLGQITDRLERQLVFALAGSFQNRRILDVGCGDAALLADLARRGAIVTGLDENPAMLAAARARLEQEDLTVTLVKGNALNLPFADASFDIVMGITVLCFVEDDERAIDEMTRVLRPGGRVVIGELGRWSLWAAQRRVKGWLGSVTWRAARFRSAKEIAALLESTGLDVTMVRGAIYYPPCSLCASFLSPVDAWFHRLTIGAAFVAIAATKPYSPSASTRSRNDVAQETTDSGK